MPAFPIPFRPVKTLRISATTSASSATALPARTQAVEVSNESAGTLWVLFGASTVAAAIPANGANNGAYPVLANQTRLVSLPAGSVSTAMYASVILSTGTGESYLACGEGL